MSKSILNKVKSLYATEKYEEAFEILNSEDSRNIENPSFLVWKSRCLLLLNDNVPSDSLRQAELYLEKALDIDADYLSALIDLAYFHLYVLDNSKKGKKLFEKAIQLSKEKYVESLVGLVECEAELVSNKSALELLSKHETKKFESSAIKKLKTNLNS